MIQTYMYALLVVVIAYLIGSIPTGYILVKVLKGEDLRKIGSGSTGATNVKRVLGKKGFFTVMVLDGLKGYLPVLATRLAAAKLNFFPEYGILPILVSIAIIIGHSKSIFLGFKGGKSVASGVCTILGLHGPTGLLTILIWSSLTYFSKYVSFGSIVAVLLTPVWMFIFKQPIGYIIYCLLGGLYITLLHRDNIKRLLAGTENKVR